MTKIQGKSILVRVGARFELSGVNCKPKSTTINATRRSVIINLCAKYYDCNCWWLVVNIYSTSVNHCRGIGHQCYGQLTAVQKGHPLTSVTLLYRELSYTTHWNDALFKSNPLSSFWFSIDLGLRYIFLKVEFSLLSAYGKSWITWERLFLRHS